MIKNILCLQCPPKPIEIHFLGVCTRWIWTWPKDRSECGPHRSLHLEGPFEILAGLKVDIYLHIIKMPPPFTPSMKGAHSRPLNEPHMEPFWLRARLHTPHWIIAFLRTGTSVISWPLKGALYFLGCSKSSAVPSRPFSFRVIGFCL